MNSLPTELHNNILSFLERADFPSYRLISKRCADIGATVLFEIVTFKTCPESIERMHALSQSYHKRYVKILHFEVLTRVMYVDGADLAVCETVLRRFQEAGCPITTLRMVYMSPNCFDPDRCSISFQDACADVSERVLDTTSDSINQHTPSVAPNNGILYKFLGTLKQIVLIDRRCGTRSALEINLVAHVNDKGFVTHGLVWPTPQSLSPDFLNIVEVQLTNLLDDHKVTIKQLELASIVMYRVYVYELPDLSKCTAWKRMFGQSKPLHNYRCVTLKDALYDGVDDGSDRAENHPDAASTRAKLEILEKKREDVEHLLVEVGPWQQDPLHKIPYFSIR